MWGVSLVGPGPEPAGSDTLSRWIVSELTSMVGHPADVTELLGVGKKPTYLVTRCVRNEVFYVKVKEKRRKDRVFLNI